MLHNLGIRYINRIQRQPQQFHFFMLLNFDYGASTKLKTLTMGFNWELILAVYFGSFMMFDDMNDSWCQRKGK